MKNVLKRGFMFLTMLFAAAVPFVLLNNTGKRYVEAPKVKLRSIFG